VIAEKTNIPDLIEWLDLDKLHVHAPTTVVLVCGGKHDIANEGDPTSFRNAFFKIAISAPFSEMDCRVPEEMSIYGPGRNYKDWMEFEVDFAQLCQLIMLFCESEGSIAELGTFAGVEEIARKLVVIIDEVNFRSDSYITLGPVTSIKDKYGQYSIYVMKYSGLNIEHRRGFSGVNLEEFRRRLADFIPGALDARKEPRAFDRLRSGHRIKLITGLVQHFGALTKDEIEFMLWCMDVSVTSEDVLKYIECAKLIDWLAEDVSGVNTYYVSRQNRDAFEYKLVDREGVPKIGKLAWRALVRQYWKEKDPERFGAIISVVEI
jgi:hypothetical protein